MTAIRRTVQFAQMDPMLMDQDGVPWPESAMELEIDNCIRCGKPPGADEQGGELVNITVREGVMYADNICADCSDWEEFF